MQRKYIRWPANCVSVCRFWEKAGHCTFVNLSDFQYYTILKETQKKLSNSPCVQKRMVSAHLRLGRINVDFNFFLDIYLNFELCLFFIKDPLSFRFLHNLQVYLSSFQRFKVKLLEVKIKEGMVGKAWKRIFLPWAKNGKIGDMQKFIFSPYLSNLKILLKLDDITFRLVL